MRRWRVVLPVLVLLCLLAQLAGHAEGDLTVSFLNVGKADAILLRTEHSAVLIDAGTNKGGPDVLEYLRAQGVEALDALIITHYDKDHVGGADAVLEGIPVARALDPAYAKDGKQYEQYEEALQAAGCARVTLSENTAFALDGVDFEIDVANAAFYGADEENDFSLIVRVRHGDCTFLFAGDAENPRLAELLDEGDLAADVLKVPHHGRYEKLSPAFFAAVGARWGIVTSSDEEPEDAETLAALRQAGTEPLLTREGTVVVTSDGREIVVEQHADADGI